MEGVRIDRDKLYYSYIFGRTWYSTIADTCTGHSKRLCTMKEKPITILIGSEVSMFSQML